MYSSAGGCTVFTITDNLDSLKMTAVPGVGRICVPLGAAAPFMTESHHLPAYPLLPGRHIGSREPRYRHHPIAEALHYAIVSTLHPFSLTNVFQMRPIQSWYQLLRCLQQYPIYGQKPEVPPRYDYAEDRPRSAFSNPMCMRLGWPGRDSQRTAALCGE
jgi:hypothetical protein